MMTTTTIALTLLSVVCAKTNSLIWWHGLINEFCKFKCVFMYKLFKYLTDAILECNIHSQRDANLILNDSNYVIDFSLHSTYYTRVWQLPVKFYKLHGSHYWVAIKCEVDDKQRNKFL